MMEVVKIEAGCYEVKTRCGTYKVVKDSYLGGWGIFDNDEVTYNHLLITKSTKKECLDFLDGNFKDLTSIKSVPDAKILSKFKIIDSSDKNIWTINDVVYSSRKGKWVIDASYYNDSIDCGSYSWDYDDFESECSIIDEISEVK